VLSGSPHRLLALGGLLCLATACAEHLQLGHEQPSAFWTGRLFWPPPPASSIWVAAHSPWSAAGSSLLDVAARVTSVLSAGGYRDARLIPVGLGYAHGFAIATRLERVAPAGSRSADVERWSALFPVAPEMRWLAFASAPTLPSQGRFRTLLVSFTDLPLDFDHRPPVEDEWTVMDGPDVPQGTRLPASHPGPRYRFCLHVYEFEAQQDNRSVRLDDGHVSEPAWATAARLALSSL
jgi:hypothetical protein